MHYPTGYFDPKIFIAIDPGTNHLGLTVFRVDFQQQKILELIPGTVHVEEIGDLPYELALAIAHNERFYKLMKIRQHVTAIVQKYSPYAVICEAPFYNRLRPSAFGPLVETIQTLKILTVECNPEIEFHTVPPTLVKKGVGAGHVASKDEVKFAVMNIPEIQQASAIDLSLLDEHAIDSIAIGYTYLQWIFKG